MRVEVSSMVHPLKDRVPNQNCLFHRDQRNCGFKSRASRQSSFVFMTLMALFIDNLSQRSKWLLVYVICMFSSICNDEAHEDQSTESLAVSFSSITMHRLTRPLPSSSFGLKNKSAFWSIPLILMI